MYYPAGWKPRDDVEYTVTEKQCDGGTVRLYDPQRTPEQQASFIDYLDRSVREALPVRKLRRKA